MGEAGSCDSPFCHPEFVENSQEERGLTAGSFRNRDSLDEVTIQ